MSSRILSRNGKTYSALRRARSRAIHITKRLSAVEATTYIHRTARVPRDFASGHYVFIGEKCWIAPQTQIGDYTLLAPRVAIVGDDHSWASIGIPIQFAGRPEQRRTAIGRDCWIGYGAIIMRGVTIGQASIVAAGAVVTADIPDNEIWGGVPARRIRQRFNEEQFEQHQRILDMGDISATFVSPQQLTIYND